MCSDRQYDALSPPTMTKHERKETELILRDVLLTQYKYWIFKYQGYHQYLRNALVYY